MKRSKAQEALRIAKAIAKKSQSSIDFHNAFFGIAGKFGEMFPERADREAFAKTAEYREIIRIREEMQDAEAAAT